MQRKTNNLGDYGPQLFCVASDSLVYWQSGKKTNCNFISDIDYSSCCQWHNTKIKGIFRESIFLWVFEIQVCNNEEIIVTAVDVVEGQFLVMP